VSGLFRTVYGGSLDRGIDLTYDYVKFIMWGGTELWLVIILGSIPPLRPLFVKIFHKAKKHTMSSRLASRTDYAPGTHPTNTIASIPGVPKRPELYRGLTHDTTGSQEFVLMPKDGIVVHSTFEMVESKTEPSIYVTEEDLEKGQP